MSSICGLSNINLSLSGQTTEDAGYLYICYTYGTNLDIICNPTKSYLFNRDLRSFMIRFERKKTIRRSLLFKIGKDFSKNVPDLCVDGQNMACVDTLKYCEENGFPLHTYFSP